MLLALVLRYPQHWPAEETATVLAGPPYLWAIATLLTLVPAIKAAKLGRESWL